MTDDDAYDETSHKTLLNSIAKLSQTKLTKKATRTEPALAKSEFNLVKPRDKAINVNDLVSTLAKKKFKDVNKKMSRIVKKTKRLEKPLEKPKEDRVRRKMGYENAVKIMDEWEPVVEANRVAETLYFPLATPKDLRLMRKVKHKEKTLPFSVKSTFEKHLEDVGCIEPEPIDDEEEEEKDFTLTREEIAEKRKELAKFRARLSYEAAKSHRQKKIKSKSYHRLQKRQAIKQQMKEFETLQKTNPDEALEKLNEIERQRARERMTLRHKSTGQWAKNLTVRAKYDRESRQQLAAQLSIAKEITQKFNANESDDEHVEDDSEELKTLEDSNSLNPWVGTATNGEGTSEYTGYRKYWAEKNKNQELVKEYLKMNGLKDTEVKPEKLESHVQKKTPIEETGDFVHTDTSDSESIGGGWIVERVNSKKTVKSKKPVKFKKPVKPKKTVKSKKQNPQTPIDDDAIDELFDELDEKTAQLSRQKLKSIAREVKTNVKTIKVKRKPQKKTRISLAMKRKKMKAIVDEELDENAGTTNKLDLDLNERYFQSNKANVTEPEEKAVESIDTAQIMKLKASVLESHAPDGGVDNDHLDDVVDEQLALVQEAFEDEDIVGEFVSDKKADIDENTPKELDLTLPGWGEWTGPDAVAPKCSKRIFLKAPQREKRRDDNKGNLIIKERKADAKLREHQVNELLFPFKSVKDFEASIRAPIGETFVPERAFHKLIEPKVVTTAGVIIEPMGQDQLLANKNIYDHKRLKVRKENEKTYPVVIKKGKRLGGVVKGKKKR